MKFKDELKTRICAEIDARRDEIIALGETILRNPETGFKEFKTASLVADKLEELGVSPKTGLAVTGVKGRKNCGGPGPTLAILGELDSLIVLDHPHANPRTGAAHACGHNAQVARMLGAAMALSSPGITDALSGSVVFFAVSAEEIIEVADRMRMKARGEIEFLAGKSELIRLGHFDDVDLAMMFHTKTDDALASHVAKSSGLALGVQTQLSAVMIALFLVPTFVIHVRWRRRFPAMVADLTRAVPDDDLRPQMQYAGKHAIHAHDVGWQDNLVFLFLSLYFAVRTQTALAFENLT